RLPVLRWQCSSVMISVTYRRVSERENVTASMDNQVGTWALAHYEEPFYSQRTAKLPYKLARTGILGLPGQAKILDAGCGKGEALAYLRQFGYRNLTGADVLKHEEWQRFE